jgi:hypothetical protein
MFGLGATAMFDIYINDRRDLLVVRKGYPIPVAGASGRWRKSKKNVGAAIQFSSFCHRTS